jgi:hypothetical protein
MEYYGLAALMAVAWDSQLSPVDNRSLTLAQVRGDAVGPFFALAGTKTGTAAAATLTPWSQAILIAYLKKFGADLLDTAPLFWTRDGRPISRRGDTGQWAAITAAAGIFSRGRTPKIPSTRISAPCACSPWRDRGSPVAGHAPVGSGRGRCWRRIGRRSIEQDGQHHQPQQQAPEGL